MASLQGEAKQQKVWVNQHNLFFHQKTKLYHLVDIMLFPYPIMSLLYVIVEGSQGMARHLAIIFNGHNMLFLPLCLTPSVSVFFYRMCSLQSSLRHLLRSECSFSRCGGQGAVPLLLQQHRYSNHIHRQPS